MTNLELFIPAYANDNDAYVPEIWANEALIQLEANMVAAQLVHRDFSSALARFGDTVNTRRPRQFKAKFKTQGDSIDKQDAVADNVAVVLNRHIHVSYPIFDEEASLSFADLLNEYIEPAGRAMAQMLDEIVLGTMYEFVGSSAGKLGAGLTRATLVSVKQVLDDAKVPNDGMRNIILGSSAYNGLLNVDELVRVNESGTSDALRNGQLGSLFGMGVFMDQNCPNISSLAGATTAGAINEAAGYSIGETTVTVDGFTGALTVGSWMTVAGDMTPLKITATTETLGDTTSITFEPALKSAVSDDAVITVYNPAAVNEAAGYAVGYSKAITIDGASVAPQSGQMISLAGIEYSAVDDGGLSTTSVTLNKALEAAAADDAVVGFGPAGAYGFAFHKNAVTLVTRPLATPRGNVNSAVASYNGLSMRVTWSYDHDVQADIVTFDLLAGIKVLDDRLGCIIYS